MDPHEQVDDERIDEMFRDMKYPGSRHDRRPPTLTPGEGWDSNPKVFNVDGVETQFFRVGALAQALNRKPFTIRKWERQGVLPPSRFATPKNERLYTRDQIEGIVRIAKEEGLLMPRRGKAINTDRFSQRVTDLLRGGQ